MLKPRSTSTRELVNLDGLWRFVLDVDAPDGAWTKTLPGALEAAVPASYNDQFVDARIRDHVGWVYYQRTVRVPRGWSDERIMLRIEAATHEGRVYVDDVLVAEHVGGYTPFDADITEHVSSGQEFRLTIAVGNELTYATIPPGTLGTAVSGRKTQSYLHDFFNYAGLARSVWLYSTPRERIEDVVITTDVEGAVGFVDYRIRRSGTSDVRVSVVTEDGAIVASGTGVEGRLRVEDARLWQPGAAYLYTLRMEIVGGDAVIDSYDETFGIRTVEVRGAEFFINGEPFYFTGFGKHEDTPVRGKGHDPAYLVHDIELMDWMGANSFRTSHYPYAEEVLEYADRHGLVVIDETAAVGLNMLIQSGLAKSGVDRTFGPEVIGDASRDALAQHVRELIARDKNHPSVVMWSITNEPASNEDGAREYFEPIVQLARELDPSRPLTYAIVMFATIENDKIADLFDVLSLNRYWGWYVMNGDLDSAEIMLERDLTGWAGKYDKPLIMSEYGADTVAGLHSLADSPFTEEYQVAYLEMHGRVFDRIPALVGEQVWNFADFRTASGGHRVDGNKKGVFTRDRRPKAAAHSLRARWTAIGDREPDTTAQDEK